MTQRKYLIGAEARDLFLHAVEKHVPATVTTDSDDNLQVLKSNFLSLQANRLSLALPVPEGREGYAEPIPGQEIAVTFKKGYYKHIFVTRIVAREACTLEDGISAPAIVVLLPDQIERIQRRAYNRAAVPSMMRIPVACSLANIGPEQSSNTFEGLLQNVSAGGLGLTSNDPGVEQCQVGQRFSVSFVPPLESLPIEVVVRLRHIGRNDQETAWELGFQIIGLELQDEGAATLRRLGRLANRFHRQSQFS